MPRGDTVTTRTPMEPKAKNLPAAKAKAKRVAAKHDANHQGIQRNESLHKARLAVAWTAPRT